MANVIQELEQAEAQRLLLNAVGVAVILEGLAVRRDRIEARTMVQQVIAGEHTLIPLDVDPEGMRPFHISRHMHFCSDIKRASRCVDPRPITEGPAASGSIRQGQR